MKKLLTISLLAFLGTTMTNSVYSSADKDPHKGAHKEKEHKKEEPKGGSLAKIVKKLGLDMDPHVGNIKSILAEATKQKKSNIEIHVDGVPEKDNVTLTKEQLAKATVVYK